MKLKRVCVALAVAGLAIPASSAVAGNGDKVTGGGQVLLDSSDVKRSTIAFTAQGTTTAAKGQVQFINRQAGAGQNQVKYHGIVDCVEVTGNRAIVGGYQRGNEDNRFVLRVIDNGEPNRGADLIAFDDATNAPDDCGDDDDDSDPTIALAKGNAQVRDGDSGNPPESRSMSWSSALKLAGLRR